MNLKQIDMKKIIAILLLAAFALGMAVPDAGAAARKKKVNSGAVAGLVREYTFYEGFDVVSVGGLGLGLVKMIGRRVAETEEEKAAFDLFDGIRKVIVVDYMAAGQDKIASFNRKMSGLLEGAEKIVEVRDDGENLDIYGMTSDDGNRIEDVIVFIPEECSLICLFGNINSQNVIELIEMEMADE